MANEKNSKFWARGLKRLRLARRSVMFLMRTLLVVTLGAIVCIAAFMTAERISNLYILATEGMAMRAKCILESDQTNDLQEYFALSCIAEDTALTDGVYANYTITGYDYDLTVRGISVMPWSSTATVTATEEVSVKGTINADMISEGESAADFPVPPWTPVKYRIHFLNTNTRWFITGIEVVETNPVEEALNTPNPDLTPRPMATPTPEPTESPVPVPAG